MLINNNGITANAGASTKQKVLDESAPAAKENASSQSPGDNVALSKEGQLLSQLEAKITQTTDVDNAKVDRLRQAIENGSYTIDANAIADKMLDADKAY